MSIIFSGRGRLQCFCGASSVFFHQVSLLQRRSLRPPPQCLSEQSWRESCRSSLTVPLSSLTPASPLCPHPPSRGSACPRNKVVPSNCSNGVLSSLDSWPWLCVIRVGQRGLEVPPQGLFNSPSHQSIPQIQFTHWQSWSVLPFQTGWHLLFLSVPWGRMTSRSAWASIFPS